MLDIVVALFGTTVLKQCKRVALRGIFTHFCRQGEQDLTYHQHLDLLHFCTISLLGERHFPMIVYSRKLNFPVLEPRDTIIIISKTLAGLFFFLLPMESAIHSWFSVLIFCLPGSRKNSKVEGKLEVQTAEAVCSLIS